MKDFGKILLILVFTVFAFNSCGDDDDKKTEYSFDGSYTSSVTLQGIKDNAALTEINGDSDKSIDEMMRFYENEYVKPITKADLQYRNSYIKISGLNENRVILSNVTIDINGEKKHFDRLTQDTEFSTNNDLIFLNNALNKIVKTQKINVKVSFKPSEDISITDKVTVTIHFDAKFYYWK
ncbi:MAG: hypothetical protein ACLVKO_10200 [Dysgonomonas sp.]